MGMPYIGEIRLLPYPRGAPMGWQLCDGSLLSIAEYETLYVLLGTTYGGNGATTFGVPDLRGRVPIHQGKGLGLSTYVLGQIAGTETVTLTSQEMAQHSHGALVSATPAVGAGATLTVPAAGISGDPYYAPDLSGATVIPLAPSTILPSGGNQAHENCAPTLTLNYCIATVGIYPSQP